MCLMSVISPASAYAEVPEGTPYFMTDQNRKLTIDGLSMAKKGQWEKAQGLIASTRDPLAAKIYSWLYYTKKPQPVSFSKIAIFMEANPDWPQQGTLAFHAEMALKKEDLPESTIIKWFSSHEPVTADGMDLYLQSLEKSGKKSEAAKALNSWWSDKLLGPYDQDVFLKKYKKYILKTASVSRLDTLLQYGYYTSARAIARGLGSDYQALAEARIALAENKGGVDQAVSRVPARLRNDPGIMLERVKWRRRNGHDVGAIELLHKAPEDMGRSSVASAWWLERHIMIRRLLEAKKYESAYALASTNVQKEGLPFAQAEFLSGWIALRFLKKPWVAFEHFEALYQGVSTPISLSRAAYWAGRASDDLSHPDISTQWYRTAARHQTTFYGQLALQKLEAGYKPPMQIPPKRTLNAEVDFNSRELVQATILLHQAGYRKETTAFLNAIADKLDQPEEFLLLAELSQHLDHFHNAIRIAKKGIGKNIFLMDHAYPTLLSSMKNVDVEWALVHGLIRQESQFDAQAQSPAGASGLMQLMPGTAKDVARKKNISHQTAWLTSKPSHNIALGSAYLQEMLVRYDGSYPMALAAYNAGPGRVDTWVKTFGDPRTAEIDMLDWMELMPIYETRNYVQRVLEAVYVYRLKFGDLDKNNKAYAIHTDY